MIEINRKHYSSTHLLLSSPSLSVIFIIFCVSSTVCFANNTTTLFIETFDDVLSLTKVILNHTNSSQPVESFTQLVSKLNQLHRHELIQLPKLTPISNTSSTSSSICDKLNLNASFSRLCQTSRQCLTVKSLMDLTPENSELHQILARTCPLILFRRENFPPFCPIVDEKGQRISNQSVKTTFTVTTGNYVEPPIEQVWGYGILFVTLSIVVSMAGLIVLPFFKRDFRRTILTLLEGLAVGGLSGSAIIHLLPPAFGIPDEKFNDYFSKTFVIFFGIYLFYIIERLLKIWSMSKSRRKRTYSTGHQDLGHQSRTPSFERFELRSYYPEYDSLKERMDKCLESFDESRPDTEQRTSGIPKNEKRKPKPIDKRMQRGEQTSRRQQRYVKDVAGRRKDQYTSIKNPIDPVAWMIVLGDASLNFIDGLLIGAAFDRNILAGISISVAVMLEEVPHRLGTFAVLSRAGMTMKQSFTWIFIAACPLYLGLVLGVFLGDQAENASPFIFAVSSGMFLYMSLVDVMREMNRTIENASRKGVRSSLWLLVLQNVGIFIAITCLSVLALYQKDMDFEAREEEIDWDY